MICLKSINLFKIKKQIRTKAAVDVHKGRRGVGSSLICYLTAPRPNLGHYQGDSVNHSIILLKLKGYMEPHNKAGSLTPAEHLVGFEPGAFQFYLSTRTEYLFRSLQYLFSSQHYKNFILLSEFLISINRIIQQEKYQENIGKNLFRRNH